MLQCVLTSRRLLAALSSLTNQYVMHVLHACNGRLHFCVMICGCVSQPSAHGPSVQKSKYFWFGNAVGSLGAGGYMVSAAVTAKYCFDLQPGDVYWCTADCGWITGARPA